MSPGAAESFGFGSDAPNLRSWMDRPTGCPLSAAWGLLQTRRSCTNDPRRRSATTCRSRSPRSDMPWFRDQYSEGRLQLDEMVPAHRTLEIN